MVLSLKYLVVLDHIALDWFLLVYTTMLSDRMYVCSFQVEFYSLAKIYRPDLLEAIRISHRSKYYQKLISEGNPPAVAAKEANKKYDWFWRQIHGNMAGPDGQPIMAHPPATTSDLTLQNFLDLVIAVSFEIVLKDHLDKNGLLIVTTHRELNIPTHSITRINLS